MPGGPQPYPGSESGLAPAPFVACGLMGRQRHAVRYFIPAPMSSRVSRCPTRKWDSAWRGLLRFRLPGRGTLAAAQSRRRTLLSGWHDEGPP
jgi:hypothetical protein